MGGPSDQSGIPNGTMGVSVFDYNLDGLPDIWITNYEKQALGCIATKGTVPSCTRAKARASPRWAICSWGSDRGRGFRPRWRRGHRRRQRPHDVQLHAGAGRPECCCWSTTAAAGSSR